MHQQTMQAQPMSRVCLKHHRCAATAQTRTKHVPTVKPACLRSVDCASSSSSSSEPDLEPITGAQHSRRTALLLASAATVAICSPSPAVAGPVSDSIKGLLLRAQRQNGGAKLLAPFGSAKIRLMEAQEQLTAAVASGRPAPEAVLATLRSVRSSSLNCYLFEALPGDNNETRASLLTQQMQLADPCTFRLIVKNVFEFSPPEVRAQGADKVNAIIRSYALLDESLLNIMQEGASKEDMEQAQQQLGSTVELVASLESFVAQQLQA